MVQKRRLTSWYLINIPPLFPRFYIFQVVIAGFLNHQPYICFAHYKRTWSSERLAISKIRYRQLERRYQRYLVVFSGGWKDPKVKPTHKRTEKIPDTLLATNISPEKSILVSHDPLQIGTFCFGSGDRHPCRPWQVSVDGISISAAPRVARWGDLGSMYEVIWEMNFSPEVGFSLQGGYPS